MTLLNDVLNVIKKRGRKIQIKQGLSADFKDSELDVGEFGLLTDTNEVRIGLVDGTTLKVNGSDSTVADIPDASITQKGLMTPTFVAKLNGISSGANYTEVVNNLTSTSTTSVLSAYQGNLLNQKIDNHINDLVLHNSDLNQYITERDSNGFYKNVTFKRTDNTTFMISVLSNPDSNGYYQALTWDFYATNGTTKILTKIWTMTYDAEGNVTSKVVS